MECSGWFLESESSWGAYFANIQCKWSSSANFTNQNIKTCLQYYLLFVWVKCKCILFEDLLTFTNLGFTPMTQPESRVLLQESQQLKWNRHRMLAVGLKAFSKSGRNRWINVNKCWSTCTLLWNSSDKCFMYHKLTSLSAPTEKQNAQRVINYLSLITDICQRVTNYFKSVLKSFCFAC